NLRAFLADANDRGVLRRNGTAWQFRHALLQEHLSGPVEIWDLRQHAAAGNSGAALQLAKLLRERDADTAEAIRVLTEHAGGGDTRITKFLATLLAAEGDIVQLRMRADHGDRDAAHEHAKLLVARNDVAQ